MMHECAKLKTYVKRKLRRDKTDKILKKTGAIYHRHYGEIVVTEKELLLQLKECSEQTNLLMLLLYGKMLPDYELRLMRVALKYAFVGSFVFSINESNTTKPPGDVYVKELFQGFYESVEEVKEHIERIVGRKVSEELANNVFRKMVFVINNCCPLMAETFEIRNENTYRLFVEYAIQNDVFDFPQKYNIWKLYPKDVPKKGDMLNYLLSKLPEDFAEQFKIIELKYEKIRR